MKYYTVILKKSGKQSVALCLELGVVGCGSTRPKANEGLRSAIESYLEYAVEVGLPETRPVAIKELHEFLFHDKLAKPVKSRNGRAQITTLSYA